MRSKTQIQKIQMLHNQSKVVLSKTLDCLRYGYNIHLSYEISRLEKPIGIQNLLRGYLSFFVTNVLRLQLKSYIRLSGNIRPKVTYFKNTISILASSAVDLESNVLSKSLKNKLLIVLKSFLTDEPADKVIFLDLENEIIEAVSRVKITLLKLKVQKIIISHRNTIQSEIICLAAISLNLKIIQIAPTILQFELIGYLPRRVDKIYVRSEYCKSKLLASNQYNGEEVKVYSSKNKIEGKSNSDKSILLVFEQIRNQVNPLITTYWEDIVNTVKSHGKTIIRLHPKQSLNQLTEYEIKLLVEDNNAQLSTNKNLIQDLNRAFCVIGTNSSVLIEAQQIGLPVVQIEETKIESYGTVPSMCISDLSKFIYDARGSKNLAGVMHESLDNFLLGELL